MQSICVRSCTVLSKLLKVLYSQLLQEETLVAVQLPECYTGYVIQASSLAHYGLRRLVLLRSLSQMREHTAPTCNVIPLTVKSSKNVQLIVCSSLGHLKARCFCPDNEGMKHSMYLQSDFVFTGSKPKQQDMWPSKIFDFLKA